MRSYDLSASKNCVACSANAPCSSSAPSGLGPHSGRPLVRYPIESEISETYSCNARFACHDVDVDATGMCTPEHVPVASSRLRFRRLLRRPPGAAWRNRGIWGIESMGTYLHLRV